MPGNPLTDPNWAANLADTIERVVSTVRDKTTKPLLVAYRGIVFGLIGAFGGLAALVLAVILLTRGLQAIIEWPFDHRDAVWISYLLVGSLFSVVGMLCMRKRHAGGVNA
ncbi:unannotated protein [freshwater metagenome]|uniref:Unannotated protein n=1 Tax=freshwater metagenome TaxID=449393 RepID=A0A6J7F7V4_9ZZZZ|nr:hypothetical protein [Actinomycetota bacterium]